MATFMATWRLEVSNAVQPTSHDDANCWLSPTLMRCPQCERIQNGGVTRWCFFFGCCCFLLGGWKQGAKCVGLQKSGGFLVDCWDEVLHWCSSACSRRNPVHFGSFAVTCSKSCPRFLWLRQLVGDGSSYRRRLIHRRFMQQSEGAGREDNWACSVRFQEPPAVFFFPSSSRCLTTIL